MQHLIRHKESRGRRSTRLAALAVAAAASLAGATGIVAAEGHAAPALKAEFKHPKLALGLLTITGTEASDKIALRLQAGEPDLLQVDVGDDGSADFSFKRKHIAKLQINARAGDDLVRIDESNGAFTDSTPTTI